MKKAVAVERRETPTRGGGGPSTRATWNERGGRVTGSICHGLVEETAHVQVPCSCDVHRRCALGFVEDAVPRARANGARTITHYVTRPNPALHAVHQEVDLRLLLQQIPGLGKSADTTEEKAIGARVTAQLSSASTGAPPPQPER